MPYRKLLSLFLALSLAGCTNNTQTSLPTLVARIAPGVVAIGDDQQSLATAFFVTPRILATGDHVLTRQPLYLIAKTGKRTRLILRIRDSAHDIALLETRAESHRPLPLAQTPPVVGETVLALGNPFGGGIVATRGIISALPEALNQTALLQTDAAINPGNSGGPLLDVEGRVVGMVVARGAPASGIGFAVPVEHIRTLLGRLKNSSQ